MPEVIEVKKYADFISKHLLNKQVTQIQILGGRYKKHGAFENYNSLKNMLPLKVVNIGTKGKLLWIQFEATQTKTIIMSFTLGLSGGFLFKTGKKIIFPKIFSDNQTIIDLEKEKTDIIKFQNTSIKHINLTLKTISGTIGFYDALSYGTINVYKTLEKFKKRLATLGPDIMNPNTTFEIFRERILQPKNFNKAIGNVIVNQKIISGVGNYLRSDILWLVKISPFRSIKNLKDSELKKIYEATRHLIWSDYNKKKGIKLGLVNKKYRTPEYYGRIFFVYQQNTDPNGKKVSRAELYEGSQKRIIHFVKGVQI